MSASGLLHPVLIHIWEARGVSEFQLLGSHLPRSSGQGSEAGGGGPYHRDPSFCLQILPAMLLGKSWEYSEI